MEGAHLPPPRPVARIKEPLLIGQIRQYIKGAIAESIGFYTGVMAYADGRSNTTGVIDQAVLT